ncbi:hypothetical protein [Bradyrhizobium retamae]|uniref:LysR substrate-binding domain-containing protein n=1 Tax=Bradyrhizobium retamae TaxID=1300035 RepID=A0A0R3N9N7_9BRAD|nr:hypothetical protein [Bradyrhizobium retamae]KRR28859.1 hypothetical protein CQ13_18655 [Bradyrhizobium retamae]
MNSLDALAAARRRRHDSRAVMAGKNRFGCKLPGVRLLADYKPAPAPLHLMLQPSRLASPKIRAFVDYLSWDGGVEPTRSDERPTPIINRN